MIRPFQLGDIFLIQRLSPQATKLHATQALLHPQSATWTALKAANPLNGAKVITYVLTQQGHQLARAGFLQMEKRPGRPEADITLLSPGLDTPKGHPAVWEKLLSFAVQEAARQQIERIFVDVPDQPLPVNTFAHVGFKLYKHQTIWRLAAPQINHPRADEIAATVRPVRPQDTWALEQLYMAVTPGDVRRAEGFGSPAGHPSPILDGCQFGVCSQYVLEERGDLTGAIHLIHGQRGTLLRLWTDTLQPDGWRVRALLHFALNAVWHGSMRMPLYIGVNDYHGGMSAVLDEFGFAPFTDRANMVKPVLAWAREVVPVRQNAIEPVGEVVTTPFVPPHPHSAPIKLHDAVRRDEMIRMEQL